MELITISRYQIDHLDKQYRTNLINSITGFKSVALIGSQNKASATNLALFSQIIHVGANPPLLGILFRPHTVPRHTLENILENQFFTVNHLQEAFVEKAHQTSARWDTSEFDACHLTPLYSPSLKAPYVEEAQVRLGLQYVEHHTLTVNQSVFLVGEILEIILPQQVIGEDGFVDLMQAGTLTCSGLDSYHSTQKVVRYSYAKPNLPLKKI